MFESLKKEAVILYNESQDKEEALNFIIRQTCEVFRIPDCDSIISSIIDRESKLSTGIGLGIAVPHCRSDKVQKIVMAVMLHPLPRWAVIRLQSSKRLPSTSAARCAT